MSPMEPIVRLLREATRLRLWRQAWRGAFQGLLAASFFCLAGLLAWKLLPLPFWVPLLAVAALPLGLLAGALAAAARRPGELEMAQWLDRRLDLDERLSTAWEWQKQQHPWREMLCADAARHAAECPPERLKQLLPPKVPAQGRWALLSLALAAALGFVPEYRSPARQQAALEKDNLSETGRRLMELAKHQMKSTPPALPPTQKALEAVAELGSQWNKAPPTRNEALSEAAQLAAELRRQVSELEKNPGLKKLEKAARETGLRESADPAALQRQVEELQNKLGAAAGQGEKLQDLQKRLEKARAAAEKLAQAKGDEAEAARQQLAQALSALQKEAMQLGQNLEGLDAALKALAEGKPDQVLKNLDLATLDLEQLRQLAEKLKQAQKALEQATGKNLAEQLELGQAGAAMRTLEQWRQQLQSGNPSPEQLQKMMEDLKKALKPAQDYGQLRAKLEQALQHLQSGRREQAAQSLGEAIKELEDLLNQMNDAEALAECLQGLLRAQEAIAQGQCMGLGRGNQARAGKAGRPSARGVGDWTDEGWDPKDLLQEELADNSDIQRPDKDPRGHTERNVEKPANLDPAKIQGKINPGQPMPSITLKGVSIKGASKIEYEEAAAAAQAEAQNALNQDRVPRAYRQQVKEYFDELK
ncbi:MAG: hypothetical protein N3J91_00660 [Verrucomicrobiae bacterium]|nr:hypothetical protein [Verrucomicrobiae bacterium]